MARKTRYVFSVTLVGSFIPLLKEGVVKMKKEMERLGECWKKGVMKLGIFIVLMKFGMDLLLLMGFIS